LKRIVALILLLLAGTVISHFGLVKATTVPNPIIFTLKADVNGWNFTTGTNPGLTQFRGVQFTAKIVWTNLSHDFALYTKGYSPDLVTTTDTCSPLNTNGCLKASSFVSTGNPSTTFSFAPAIPKDDFSGPGTYEYFCQLHPTQMHGQITLYKSPDLLNRGKVDIVDASTLAFAFDTTPANATWSIAADLDNDGKISIVDASILAFYFDQPF